MAELRRPSDLAWSERVEERAARLAVRPSRWKALPPLAIGAVWDALGVLFVTRGVLDPAFMLVLAAPGIYLTRSGLALLLNRSCFELDGNEVALTHRPVPTRAFRMPTSSVEGFDAIAIAGKRGVLTWRLRVLLRGGSAEKLSLPLTTHEHVSFVAARLNAALARVREPRGYRDA